MSFDVKVKFSLDPKEDAKMAAAFGDGLDAFALVMADHIREAAPDKTPDPPMGASKIPYRKTIRRATFVRGKQIGGKPVRGVSRPSDIVAYVYTSSFLARWLELGTAPHYQPRRRIHHPGAGRRPHFIPGMLSALSEAGPTIGGRFRSRIDSRFVG